MGVKGGGGTKADSLALASAAECWVVSLLQRGRGWECRFRDESQEPSFMHIEMFVEDTQGKNVKQVIRFLRLGLRREVCKVICIWEMSADRWYFKSWE